MTEVPIMTELFRAIVAGDASKVSSLLAAHPDLAKSELRIGATREDPKTYWFDKIGHYVYAGDTGLHVAAAAYNVDIARTLLKSGADISAKNRRGAEALHYACDGGPMTVTKKTDPQETMTTFLIASGANPNALDKSGVAPLHRAVRNRSTGTVRALLAGGADVRLKNKNGSTPLHLAVQNTGKSSSGSPISKSHQKEIIELLLKNGADPEDEDVQGKTVRQSIKEEWINELLK